MSLYIGCEIAWTHIKDRNYKGFTIKISLICINDLHCVESVESDRR